MGWQLTNFQIERHGEMAQVFHLEVSLLQADNQHDGMIMCDGLVLANGRVHLNREDRIKASVSQAGLNPHEFIEMLVGAVLSRVEEISTHPI